MGIDRPLLELRVPLNESDAVTLDYDGRRLRAREGEPLSAALLRAGILATTRSPKYRRPRGAYCLRGDCGSCQVRIDGEPNLRACTTLVRDGMRVEPQNQWGPRGLDPTPMIDRLFPGGVDHHHLVVRPRIANVVMQKVARTMTGFGTLPRAPSEAPARHVEHSPEVLVIGAGAAGRAVACALEAAGVDVLTIDRHDRATLEVSADGPLPVGLRCELGVFAAYPHERLWAAAAAPLGERLELHTIRPRHVVLAVGARDPMPPLANNDLPGVVAARGLARLVRRSGAELRARVVVVGSGDEAERLAERLGAARVDADEVVEITGGDAATGVRLRDRTLPCDLVALAPTPSPNHELAAQAGARLRFDGRGFAVVTDARGEVEAGDADPLDGAVPPRPWRLWACGDLCGYRGPTRAREDGEALALAILEARRPTSTPETTP
ncbi:MAG: 2Fe-2S iron-sulfur cluster-binding protein [Nannocystaceae bacterium]